MITFSKMLMTFFFYHVIILKTLKPESCNLLHFKEKEMLPYLKTQSYLVNRIFGNIYKKKQKNEDVMHF